MKLHGMALPVCLVICVLVPSLSQADQKRPSITALAISPAGRGHVQGSQAGVVYRTFDNKTQKSIPTKLDHIHAVVFSPDGKTLAVAGGFPAEKGVVELWSWPDAKLIGRLDDHKDVVYDAVWLDGGNRLATASADRTVRLWDMKMRKCSATLKGHSGPVLAITVTADSQWLCSASADHTIRVWKTRDGKLIRALTNHLGPVRHLAFRPSPAGSRIPYLASASSDKTIRIWQPTIGRMVRIIRHPAPISAVAWNRDGSKLFSGAKDGKLRIIDGDSDEVLGENAVSASRILRLAVSRDDRKILVGVEQGEVVISELK